MAGRIKVVFASLLKPVDEPRMYEKLGRSLAQTYKYDVNIIGFTSKNLPKDPLVTFWPIFNFNRISLGRLFAPVRFFLKLLHLKPELIVASGTDILMVSCLYKILYGGHVINDLQENYYRNIIWSHGSPTPLRKLFAQFMRMIENILDRIVIQYILAEQCYQTECSFISKPSLTLDNKASRPSSSLHLAKEKQPPLRLVYTGTIARSYGIFEAIKLSDAIHQLNPDMLLTICGHCPLQSVYHSLLAEARVRPWISLKISRAPIPHPVILQELHQAHFSLVAYQLNPANENCIPTRIWEALAWKTPVILRKEHPWKSITARYNAGFAIDYQNPDLQTLQEKLFEASYFTDPLPETIYWESLEKEWIALVDKLVLPSTTQ